MAKDLRPSSQRPEPKSVARERAPSATRFSLALDPDTGRLYPTSEPTAIQFRDDGSRDLHPADDVALPAARTRITDGVKGMVY